MFFNLRAANQIRLAMNATGVSEQVRRDYAEFLGKMFVAGGTHLQTKLLNRADASGMSVARGAYEALTLQYNISVEFLNSGRSAADTHPRMLNNAQFAIATTAALLAQGCDIPTGRLMAEFPLLDIQSRGNPVDDMDGIPL